MVKVCAESGAGVCIMHMQGEPRSMQKNPSYENSGGVVAAVQMYFKEHLLALTSQGIDADCICFDPGIGFGKTLGHNLDLLRHLEELHQDRPVLLGVSRKSLIAAITGEDDPEKDRPILLGVSRKSLIAAITGEDDPEKRDAATAAITVLAYRAGVKLHRVHNVPANVQALRVAASLCP